MTPNYVFSNTYVSPNSFWPTDYSIGYSTTTSTSTNSWAISANSNFKWIPYSVFLQKSIDCDNWKSYVPKPCEKQFVAKLPSVVRVNIAAIFSVAKSAEYLALVTEATSIYAHYYEWALNKVFK